MKYSREKIKEFTGIEIEDDWGYIEVIEEKKYKTNQQTRAFHSLLMCFWKSGCSSFNSYEDMRNHYKAVAHLLECGYHSDLKEETKQMAEKAVRLLPLDKYEFKKIMDMLRGKILIWHSWSECSKEMATVTLNQLINDMFSAGVDSSSQEAKFKEIMEGMRSWYD